MVQEIQKANSMIRVAITGPESCGKTTLAEVLSERLNGMLFLEYGREYLEELNRDYTQADLDRICQGHLTQFKDSSDQLQVIDTDFVVLKVWSKVKYETVSETIINEVKADHFDLHILCSPDIPWEYDPQREHPEMREELFDFYVSELSENHKNYIIVSGSLEDRIEKSCKAIAAIQIE